MASPDVNTEDFQAAVDFLSVQDNVDAEKIGIIGICGWGGMALSTAALDTRVKATVVSTMYDMSRVNAQGYFDAENSEKARYEKRKAMNAQRTADYKSGGYELGGGVVDPLLEDAPFFMKDYYDYCTAHVRCVAIYLIPFASYFPLLGLFQGANDALYSTFVATSALAVRVGSTYILQEIPAISHHMIWWNTIFGWGLGCVLAWTRFLRGTWKQRIGALTKNDSLKP